MFSYGEVFGGLWKHPRKGLMQLVFVSVRCYTKGGKIDPSPPGCLSCHAISLIWRQSHHTSLPLALTEQSHCWYCALNFKATN